VLLLITQWHISSVILLQAWMISALNSITVCSFFGKIFSLRNPQSSHMGLSQDYSGASSVHMRNSQEISLRWHASWKESKVSCGKSKTTFTVCGLAPCCMNHWVCNSKIVARWGTKVLRNMLK
jgi:hypothetical protein